MTSRADGVRRVHDSVKMRDVGKESKRFRDVTYVTSAARPGKGVIEWTTAL